MTNDRGLRGDRVQRSEPHENEPDIETEVIEEMEGSGRGHVFPRDGGQHTDRHLPLAGEVEHSEPEGIGTEVAPTAKAALREHERHARQRELGYVPAGEEGAVRQRRGPQATREALDRAAHEADEWVRQRDVTAEASLGDAGSWWRRHRRWLMVGAGATALGLTAYAARRR